MFGTALWDHDSCHSRVHLTVNPVGFWPSKFDAHSFLEERHYIAGLQSTDLYQRGDIISRFLCACFCAQLVTGFRAQHLWRQNTERVDTLPSLPALLYFHNWEERHLISLPAKNTAFNWRGRSLYITAAPIVTVFVKTERERLQPSVLVFTQRLRNREEIYLDYILCVRGSG